MRAYLSIRLATLDYVHWFNDHRLHGAAENLPPAEHDIAYYRHIQTG